MHQLVSISRIVRLESAFSIQAMIVVFKDVITDCQYVNKRY